MDVGRNLVIGLLILAVVVGGFFYYNSDTGQAQESSNEETSAVVVSSDPLFGSFDGSGVITFRPAISESRATMSRGPWTIDGAWKLFDRGGNRSLTLHPWVDSEVVGDSINFSVVRQYSEPSSVQQEVALPSSGDIRSIKAVMVARNGAEAEECTDSEAILEVGVPGDELSNSTVVGEREQRLTLDLTPYAGETVMIRALGDAGDDGCTLWRGEFTEIKTLFVVAER